MSGGGVITMERELKELLARAREGDAEAFAQAFEGVRGALFAVAARLVGMDEAEDVTMETYLKAWQALSGFDGRASLKSWLYRIARNCAIDTLRRRERRREIQPQSLIEGQGPFEAMADDKQLPPSLALEGEERRIELERVMQLLPEEHRLALLLRYSDGLSYGEIAAASGVPIGTVMSRLFNGKRKLRQLLKNEHEVDVEKKERRA